ncbi:MAG: hypothetical protein U9N14_06190 [Pseudomonadota bacterium]|nr:hypothetical protein [Pseudomonadota bacterium]
MATVRQVLKSAMAKFEKRQKKAEEKQEIHYWRGALKETEKVLLSLKGRVGKEQVKSLLITQIGECQKSADQYGQGTGWELIKASYYRGAAEQLAKIRL